MAEFALKGLYIGMSAGMSSKMLSSAKLAPTDIATVWFCGISVAHGRFLCGKMKLPRIESAAPPFVRDLVRG